MRWAQLKKQTNKIPKQKTLNKTQMTICKEKRMKKPEIFL